MNDTHKYVSRRSLDWKYILRSIKCFPYTCMLIESLTRLFLPNVNIKYVNIKHTTCTRKSICIVSVIKIIEERREVKNRCGI